LDLEASQTMTTTTTRLGTPAGIAGAVLTLALAGSAAALQPAPSPAPAGGGVTMTGTQTTPPAGPDQSAWPLKFETATHDWGKIDDTVAQEKKFIFVNTSGRTLTITNIRTSCGCSAATPDNDKRIYQPGETGSLKVTFDPKGRRGEERKIVTVETDDPTTKSMELSVRASVLPRIMTEPTTVYFGEVPLKEVGRSQEFSITARDLGFAVTSISAADQRVKVEELGTMRTELDGTPVNRARYRITMPSGLARGTWQSTLSLVTNDTQTPSMSVPLVAMVVGEDRVIPERLMVRMSGAGQPFAGEVVLTSRSTKPFSIVSVEPYDVPAEMRLAVDAMPGGTPGASGASGAIYRVRAAGVTPNFVTDIKGGLLIKTDHPDMAEVRVPLMGFWIGNMQPAMGPGAAQNAAPGAAPAMK
jgi:hypothetical protein